MPMKIRDTPFSSAAWEKLVYERSTGDGSCTSPGRQREAAGLEADLVGPEECLQNPRCCAALDACPES